MNLTDLTVMDARCSNTKSGFVDMPSENDISALMREIAEYRVRRQTYRWTRDVEVDDMLNSYVFLGKKKMLKEQGKVLDALKKSIAKRVFVLRKMRKVLIPAYREFFCIPQYAVHNKIQ